MADFPALPLWTDAYLADTRHLTQAEHGAYLLLLMEAWRRPRCCLPDDDVLLSRLSGSPSVGEWQALKPVVMAFWTLDARASEWTQKRMTKEREFVEKSRRQKRDAARKRWKETKKQDAAASSPHVQPTPTPTPQREDTGVSSMPAKPPAKPKRGTRLEADWKPDQELREWTLQQLDRQAATEELEKFRDYWAAKPGKDGTKLDWSATWRNWVREAVRRRSARPYVNGYGAQAKSNAELGSEMFMAAMAELEGRGGKH